MRHSTKSGLVNNKSKNMPLKKKIQRKRPIKKQTSVVKARQVIKNKKISRAQAVRSAKLELWGGIVSIAVIGFVVAVYFVFLKIPLTETTNSNSAEVSSFIVECDMPEGTNSMSEGTDAGVRDSGWPNGLGTCSLEYTGMSDIKIVTLLRVAIDQELLYMTENRFGQKISNGFIHEVSVPSNFTDNAYAYETEFPRVGYYQVEYLVYDCPTIQARLSDDCSVTNKSDIYSLVTPAESVEYVFSVTEKDTLELLNGKVSIDCKQSDDCIFVDTIRDYGICCPTSSCDDYSSSVFIAVNKEAFQELDETASKDCEDEQNNKCPQLSPPLCPANNNELYAAECVQGMCRKVKLGGVSTVSGDPAAEEATIEDSIVCDQINDEGECRG